MCFVVQLFTCVFHGALRDRARFFKQLEHVFRSHRRLSVLKKRLHVEQKNIGAHAHLSVTTNELKTTTTGRCAVQGFRGGSWRRQKCYGSVTGTATLCWARSTQALGSPIFTLSKHLFAHVTWYLTKSRLTTARVRYIPCACLKFHYTLGLGRSITVNASYMALTYLQHACIF